MLYKLKSTDSKTTFVPVTPTTMTKQGFLEKEMEQWLADNPHAVLPEDEARVLVISQETASQNLTDILAVDEQGLDFGTFRTLDVCRFTAATPA